ncbi:MAG: sulfatase [Deltaproteobacteria bacterium]|nr:sulfatase [Deltaproteobacteria bacterium]MBW2666566.1 sulfatase [Deltaproteobacteria bacterium]
MNSLRSHIRAAVALAILALVAAVGCEKPPKHLVLVTLDTARADRLSAYGHRVPTSPALATLAQRGVRFDDAIAQAIVTPPSHASILTGKNPPRHGLRQLSSEALAPGEVTLAELLHTEGFTTAAFVGAIPLLASRGLDQGFDVYDQVFPDGMIERRAGRTNRAVREWLADPPAGRVFLWVHYFDPHHPYNPPRPYKQKFTGGPVVKEDLPDPRNANPRTARKGRAAVPGPAATRIMRNLYDAELRYTDDAMAELFKMLDGAGLLADAVVAVVADHGESLGEHGYYFGHWGLFWENARVPMVLAHPDGRYAGTKVRELVRTIDLMPTLLAWLGLPAPDGLDGVDLTELIEGGPSRTLEAYTEQHEYFPVRSLRTRDWLLVRDNASQRSGTEARFRLYRRVDGRALPEDVAAGNPEVLARLTARLAALHDVDDPGEPVAIPVPDAVRQQLRALGYLQEE